MFAKLWAMLDGKKTYLSTAAMVVWAIYSVHLGQMSWNQAIEFILGASSVASVRHAMN